MGLSNELIRQFVQITNDKKRVSTESILYGTVILKDDGPYVQLDGSDVLTPVSSTADVKDDERVTVLLKNHSAIVTGNVSSPSASSKDLQETNKNIAEFEEVTTNRFRANEADIDELSTNKLDTNQADIKYAQIDFANISKATMEYFYAQSGLIKDATIGDGTITGHLVGVTISGDLIEGNTIKAEKLVIKGTDGLYYKLNVNAESTAAEQTDYNSLNGSILRAKSVTAEKISVKDLVAFGATIGGFKIGDHSLYSQGKDSISSSVNGVYFDDSGQIAIGDGQNYIKYYRAADGTYKLALNVDELMIGSGANVGEELDNIKQDIKDQVADLRDEITTLLRIESSRGTVFKNDQVATVLSVVLYHGKQRITDSATMKEVFGSSAYLQWYWQRLDDDSFGILANSDSRFGDEGFTFTLSPEDVDTKVTFMCELIV